MTISIIEQPQYMVVWPFSFEVKDIILLQHSKSRQIRNLQFCFKKKLIFDICSIIKSIV
jgi:hypothetical protein